MEIKTCEQYVLAQLRDAHEQIESLEEENSRLKSDIASSVAEIERLNGVIADLNYVIAERNKFISALKQAESDRMGENTDSIFT